TIPHFADGGGWTSQIILINPSTTAMSGSLQFIDQQTQAVVNTVNYAITPQSYYRFQTTGTGTSTQSGLVQVVPGSGGNSPGAFVIFSLRNNGVTVGEASLRAAPAGTSFKIYVENSPTIQTGIALANPSSNPVVVTLEATSLSGTSISTGTLTIAGN